MAMSQDPDQPGPDLPSTGPQNVKPIPESLIPAIKLAMRVMSAVTVALYRSTDGRWGGIFRGGPVALLTMTGRKSGKLRTTPLICIRHEDQVVFVASQGGMDKHPIWYHNLVANPDVEVQIAGERRAMRVRQASASEKQALWPTIVSVYPEFDEYQARTERDIPVMICSPR